ncbi:MAG: hypothetical protein IPK19_41905 [Chloroflexi bacterium]|nr:hypothetical protein [Chloroflexota bacterium]
MGHRRRHEPRGVHDGGLLRVGMGAFDPSMSVHGEEAESAHARSSDAAEPSRMLMGVTWQLVTLLLIATIVLFALATIPGGPTLITTAVPEASMVQVGMVEMQIGGQTVLVSQLVFLLIIIIAMFLSLLAVAGGLAWVLNKLPRGVVEAKSEGSQRTWRRPKRPPSRSSLPRRPDRQPCAVWALWRCSPPCSSSCTCSSTTSPSA